MTITSREGSGRGAGTALRLASARPLIVFLREFRQWVVMGNAIANVLPSPSLLSTQILPP